MPLATIIQSRPRDLGGFSVRRILPYATHRMVGPFIFFDHMGPASFPPGKGLDVRPHPHIHLATVTYLFEGVIHHRDSLGYSQWIEPGAINWMTAGSGIVHSERSPEERRSQQDKLEGIQCWVALPKEKEEIPPSFSHHPAHTLPDFSDGGFRFRLLLGSAFGHTSPVAVHSDIFYLEGKGSGSSIVKGQGRECALYLVSGQMEVNGETIQPNSLAIAHRGEDLEIKCQEPSHFLLLGGAPFPEKRYIWWNFVSSSKESIEKARHLWAEGKFPKVPGDEKEFIPLPNEPFLYPAGDPL